ncbi:MAG: FapA family protein, partial [Burkholderiaceae bacterium]|nr:FapA family protein [Burkholderiaceae bacterium]
MLAVADDGVRVNACFTPAGTPTASATGAALTTAEAVQPPPAPPVLPTLADIRHQLAALGCEQWWVDVPGCSQWLGRLGQARQPMVAVVAQRRDGRCAVKVSPDRMSARLSLEPPCGGVQVTLEQVHAELGRAGVRAGILEEDLARAVQLGSAAELEIAVGRLPVHGEPTRFDVLVPNLQDRSPRLNTYGLIDYRDLGDLVVVKEGTPLMRRVPCTPGEPGVDVTGGVLPA